VGWRLVLAGVREAATYRLALFAGLVANVTFGFLKYGILTATVAANGGSVGGYDAAVMSTYVWLSQGMLGSVNLFGRSDLADRVRTGDVVVEFLRPLPVQASACLRELGRGLFALLPRGLPSVLVGALLVGVALPPGAPGWVLGGVAVLLGIAVSSTTVYLVAVSGFWLVETRGLQSMYMVAAGFFAGLWVPLAVLPGWLEALAWCTPFPAMLMVPVDVLSGRAGVAGAAGLVAVQVGWLLATLLAGHLLTEAGRRRLEVQGG
jgi:ABC-2 type transport system permease protein